MSGHSKWATIKHKKGAADKARGKLFAKLIRQVEVAARQGGGDPTSNPTLRTMYQKARDASVPLDTIERAVKRGTGELEGVTYESITYEGYAPHGVALLVEVLTDNRNRTGAEIRTIFSRNGGSMAEPGAVAWQFERKGFVVVPGEVDEDNLLEVALDAGAEDVAREEDVWEITSAPVDLADLRAALDDAGIPVTSFDHAFVATNQVPLDDVSSAQQVLRIIELLEDHDDVQDVHANADIAPEVVAALD